MILDRGQAVELGQQEVLLADPTSHFAKVMAVEIEAEIKGLLA